MKKFSKVLSLLAAFLFVSSLNAIPVETASFAAGCFWVRLTGEISPATAFYPAEPDQRRKTS
jgi:hypothetical protein